MVGPLKLVFDQHPSARTDLLAQDVRAKRAHVLLLRLELELDSERQPSLTAPSPTRGRVHIARTTSPSRPPPLSVFWGTRPYTRRATELLSWVADALQLDAGQCEWDAQKRAWHICHDGRMSQVPREVVTEAVRESQAGRWIDTDDNGKERISLGTLPDADSATWRNSRNILANLIHYGIIRKNLREARSR